MQKNIFSGWGLYIANVAFQQFHISLNWRSLFFSITLWSYDVHSASYASVLPSSVNNSFLLNHWVESHQYSLGWSIPFQTCSKISTLCRNLVALSSKRKHSKILSKTSGQISKELGTNGPWDTLYQCWSNYLTILKIWPPGGVTSFSMSILMKLYFFLSDIARPCKKDNTSCLKSLAPEPWYLVCSIS